MLKGFCKIIIIHVQYSLQTVRPRRYSENLNVSVLCPLPPTFGLSRVYDSITLTDKTPKTGNISTKHAVAFTSPFSLSYWPFKNIRNCFIRMYTAGVNFLFWSGHAKNSFHITIAIPLYYCIRIGKKSQHSLRICRPSNIFS